MRALLMLLVRAYQIGISPFMAPRCRFHPSCSNYAIEAIGVHGAARGGVLAAKRLCKCHPWNPGGFDPVPQKPSEPSPTTARGCGHS